MTGGKKAWCDEVKYTLQYHRNRGSGGCFKNNFQQFQQWQLHNLQCQNQQQHQHIIQLQQAHQNQYYEHQLLLDQSQQCVAELQQQVTELQQQYRPIVYQPRANWYPHPKSNRSNRSKNRSSK